MYLRLLLIVVLAVACNEPPPASPHASTYERYPNQWDPKPPPPPTKVPQGIPAIFEALDANDTAALDTLVVYPLEVRGSLDSDPITELDAQQFYRELLLDLGGENAFFQDTTTWKEGPWPHDFYDRGDCVFKRSRNGRWQLVRVYSNRYVRE